MLRVYFNFVYATYITLDFEGGYVYCVKEGKSVKYFHVSPIKGMYLIKESHLATEVLYR